MAIKNYTAQKSVVIVAAEIEQNLIDNGAVEIRKDITDGKITALKFIIPTRMGMIPIQLPVNVQGVLKVLENDKKTNRRVKVTFDQAEKTAWANLRDWINSQIALIRIGMVDMEQVFLPYVVGPDGRTLYEVAASRGFFLESSDKEKYNG